MTRPPPGRLQAQELAAGVLRALSGRPGLQLHGLRPYRGTEPLAPAAPHLRPTPGLEHGRALRALADGLALRERHTDPAIHAAHAPAGAMACRLYELLEQYRVEALVPAHLPGVRHNLQQRHEAWADGLVAGGWLEWEQGGLVYALAQLCRSRVTGIALEETVQDRIEASRIVLAPLIGAELAALRTLRTDQAAYARQAASIAGRVAAMLERIGAAQGGARRPASEQRRLLAFWAEADGDDAQHAAGPGAGGWRGGVPSPAYGAFTRAYDVELDAATLARGEQLRALRVQLDHQVAQRGVAVGRLARHVGALFAHPAHDGWDGAQEEGRTDGRLLARLVAAPARRHVFRQERMDAVADAAVAILLDCSGSMKAHAHRVAVLVDVLLRAMEQAGLATELLGFTTSAWNGGRARRDWLRAGRPPQPGRLNELCHVVFKAADETWRRRRPAIAALLKTDWFREGIDGEAIEWACRRLREQPAARRVLLVVSDGSPMDSATSLTNDAGYLDRHLQQVLARESSAGGLEICALAIGMEPAPCWGRAMVAPAADAPGTAQFLALADLLGGNRRPGPR